MSQTFTIYCDGSCPKPNGPGGWASICLEDASLNRGNGEPETTNNRMELMGVIGGLRALPPKSTVTVYSDSEYVVRGFPEWLPNWVNHGWPSRVKNLDLWKLLLSEVSRHKRVSFRHVKGHSGDYYNELADKAAGEQTKLQRRLL